MTAMTMSEMQSVNGGYRYYCTKCKKTIGYSMLAVCAHWTAKHFTWNTKTRDKYILKYKF